MFKHKETVTYIINPQKKYCTTINNFQHKIWRVTCQLYLSKAGKKNNKIWVKAVDNVNWEKHARN